ARRALVLAHDPGNAHRGLLRHGGAFREDRFGKLRLHGDALNRAASVAHEEKLELSARAAVVQPSLNPDFLADLPLKRPDPGRGVAHASSSARMAPRPLEAREDSMSRGTFPLTPPPWEPNLRRWRESSPRNQGARGWDRSFGRRRRGD